MRTKKKKTRKETWWTIEGKYGFMSIFCYLRKNAVAKAVKNLAWDENETWKDLKKRGYRVVKVEVKKVKR